MLPGLHFPPSIWSDNSADFELVYNVEENLSVFIEDFYEPNHLPIGTNASEAISHKLAGTTSHLVKAASEDYRDSLFMTLHPPSTS